MLIRTRENKLFVDTNDGTYRAMTWVPSRAISSLESPQMAASAASLVARFHVALLDFVYHYRSPRSGVHHLPRHLESLAKTIDNHRDHRLFSSVSRVAESIVRHAASVDALLHLPLRHCHGDLKCSNVLFDSKKEALALCDLDTLGLAPWPIELGDALRSWCNRATEDTLDCRFDCTFFDAAVSAYASIARANWSPIEVQSLVAGVLNVTLELTSRFCADALNESYFGYDRGRFVRSGEHNLVRAQSQLALFESAIAQRAELEGIVARAFRS
jgi:Ser/Thr protein kinase RdoA (MazF antagonist)